MELYDTVKWDLAKKKRKQSYHWLGLSSIELIHFEIWINNIAVEAQGAVQNAQQSVYYQAGAVAQQTRVAAADEVNNIRQQTWQQQQIPDEVASNNALLLFDNTWLNAGIAEQNRTIANCEHRLRLAIAAPAEAATAAANERKEKRYGQWHNK